MTPVLIGIAGGTGSGKTTVAKRIVAGLPPEHATLVQHDWYYRDHPRLSLADRAKLNFDEPDALENTLLAQHLGELKSGSAVDCPQYDFATHTRRPETRRVEPRAVVIVEGILIFAVPAIRELLDLRLFVDTDDDIRLLRRLERDVLERGRDLGSVSAQYQRTVRPMHRRHVAPSKEHAHLVIPEGGDNAQALDVIVGRFLYAIARLEEAMSGAPS